MIQGSTGNIGVGTTSPYATLSLRSNSNTTTLAVTALSGQTADLQQWIGTGGVLSVDSTGIFKNGGSTLNFMENDANNGVFNVAGNGTAKNLQYGLAAFHIAGTYPIKLWGSTVNRGTSFTGTPNGQWTPATGDFYTVGISGFGTTTAIGQYQTTFASSTAPQISHSCRNNPSHTVCTSLSPHLSLPF
jgi:hypothetical protein